ncbi:MAG: tetratricopeptide repeat protein [Bacteroidales bacterium]|nr:tetratricopeptide repeat protein [Bacteroidales bacterium]
MSFSQDSAKIKRIDSLQNLFDQARPGDKPQILQFIAKEYLAQNPDTAKEYINRAVFIALELNDSNLMVQAYQNQGNLYDLLYEYTNSANAFVKAVEIRKNLARDTTLINLIIKTARALGHAGKFDKAEVFLLDALAICQKQGIQNELCELYFSMGNLYHSSGNYQLAARYFLLAENESKKEKDDVFLADILNNSGVLYSDIGSYEKALEYYMKSLELYEKHEDKKGIAQTLNNIGIVYYDWGNKEKSLEYYQKSLNIEVELGNKQGIADSYNNIGIVYSEWNQNELAISYYNKALDIYKLFNDSLGISNAKNNIGESYAELGNYELALKFLNESLLIEKKFGNLSGVAESLLTIGNVCFLSNELRKALSYNDKSFKIADSGNFVPILKLNHELYYKIYKQQNIFEKALYHYTLFESIKDEEYNEQFIEHLTKLQLKHEIDRKEKERKIIEQEFEKKENQALTQQIYLIIIFVLMIVFGILVYYDIRSKINANNKLKAINNELFSQKAKLSDTLFQLQKSESKYRNLVENSPSGILYIDNMGNILEANQKLLQILDLPDEKETQKINILEFEPFSGIGFSKEIKECIKSGSSFTSEKDYVSDRGKKAVLKYTINPIKTSDESVGSLIINIEDISETRETERLRHETEEKYRMLVENSLQAMLIIQDAKLIFGNSKVEELTNYSFEELSLKGNNWLKLLIHPDDLKRSLKNVLGALKGLETEARNEYRILRKDEAVRWIETLGVVVDYQGKPAILMVAVDITKRKTSEQFLLQSEKQLKEANAMKDKFFSIIAHDLKNPFSSILGFANLLYEAYDNFEERQRKNFIKNICEASENTFKLLQNLLEWSRTQTGNIEYRPEKIDINNLVNENISILRTSLKNKNLSVISEIPFNAVAMADENMIKTVVRNLLSNAIKFTKPGGEIKITVVKNEDYFKISVKDNGIGIEKENLAKLFRIDDQYRTIGTLNETGSGIGLLLCKEFVVKNKGEIKAESTKGVGSVFSFTLPAAKS